MKAKYFEYLGEPVLTRGDYGVRVRGGHNTKDSPDHISVFDPDFGDFVWVSVKSGLASGNWREITRQEWESLT